MIGPLCLFLHTLAICLKLLAKLLRSCYSKFSSQGGGEVGAGEAENEIEKGRKSDHKV